MSIKQRLLNGSFLGFAILFVIGIFLLRECYQIIPPAHKGIVMHGGKLQQKILDDGFYLKTPFWTDIVPVFVGSNTTDESIMVENFRGIKPLSKDGQVIDVDIQINYGIMDPIMFRRKVGSSTPRDIESLLFIPTVRRLVYDYVSEYTWKNLIQGGDRQELGQRIFKTMSTGDVTRRTCKNESKQIDPTTGKEVIIEAGCIIEKIETLQKPEDFGVVVTALNLRKVKPNERIIGAIEEAQKKEQEVLIAQQEAEIAKQQANKSIEQKRGETESKKLEAEAEAHKLRSQMQANADGIKAEAEAKKLQADAERALAAALSESQGLIDYKRLDIEKILAEAQLELAKHYRGNVPQTVTIIGDEAAKNGRMIYGLPNVMVNAGEE